MLKPTGGLRLALASVLAVSLTGCVLVDSLKARAERVDAAPAATQRAGHLMILGGAMNIEHAAVWSRIVELTGPGTIGVLPTASGVPAESGPGAVEDFTRYKGRAEVIDITTATRERASDPAWVEKIAAHRTIYFTGGDQARITATFRPAGGVTPGYVALQSVLGSGGTIGGSSAGAAMMSDPMIMGGTSAEALELGVMTEEDRGVNVGPGMGFFPYGITDQHFLRRGRMGRLIVAVEHTGQRFGFGVDENCAMDVNLAADTIRAIGRRGLLVVDLRDLRREGPNRLGIRVTLLGDGDLINGVTGAVTPATGKVALAPTSGSTTLEPTADAWGRDAIPQTIARLALAPASEVVALDKKFALRFSKDDRTRCFALPGGDPYSVAAVDVRLDITQR